MKKIIVLISFILSVNFNVFANTSWEHKNISTAVFALDVVKRVPQNIVKEIDNSVDKIYFYTNLRNLAGQTIKHIWKHNGKNMAEVTFHPKGNRWRVYSSKNLWRGWTGVWSVDVVDENNNIILSKSFIYNKK